MALFGHISSAGKGVRGAPHKPGASIAWSEQKRVKTSRRKKQEMFSREVLLSSVTCYLGPAQ